MLRNTNSIAGHRTGNWLAEVRVAARVLAASFRYVEACPKALAVDSVAFSLPGRR